MKTVRQALPRFLPPTSTTPARRRVWFEVGAVALALAFGIVSLQPGSSPRPIAEPVGISSAIARPTPPPPATPLASAASAVSPPARDFLAEAASALTSPPGERRARINTAYFEWAQQAPEQATQSALRLSVPAERVLAVESVLSGWSHRDPSGLAEAALDFPDGPEKTAALTKGIRAWLVVDPDAAGAWITAHPIATAITEEIIRNENR